MRRPEHTPARGASSRTDHARTASRRLIGGSRLRNRGAQITASPDVTARVAARRRIGLTTSAFTSLAALDGTDTRTSEIA